MLKRSRVVNAPGDVGDNVTVPVPLVDRGRGDPRNLLGIILDRDENEMYRIAVRAGILTGKYSRNQFDLCSQKLLTDKEVRLDREVALRTAVTDESTCGGQGFVRCNCAGFNRCQSNRCKCFKAQVKCNSRCHSCLACDNKSWYKSYYFLVYFITFIFYFIKRRLLIYIKLQRLCLFNISACFN